MAAKSTGKAPTKSDWFDEDAETPLIAEGAKRLIRLSPRWRTAK